MEKKEGSNTGGQQTHLFEILSFLFKFTKIKSTTEINTHGLARNGGAVSTSCRSNEVNWGCRTKGRRGQQQSDSA